MTRHRPRAARLITLTAILGLWVAASALPPTIAAASTHRHPPHTSVVQHGHAAFGSCPASAAHITVTVQNPSVPRGVAVKVMATVQNVGAAPCNYTHSGPIPSHAPARAYMGPCGAMSLAVYRPAHHEIWPGAVAYSCPMLTAGPLGPQQTVVVTGQWDQALGPHSGLPPLPPTGRYWMVVDGRFRFTIRIT